ncbi:MAG TPA: rRNA (cytidine-2'-O-)-methyltransferase, partial [Elusimicrobiota bacterium]|nr:rRNA (cytidine-2'-O-)-methyltransferase [Elusimicrobiota bacterium]
SKRRRILQEAAALGRTIVVYESPFRVVELLEDAEAALGPRAQAVAARELSKVHEEWLRGDVAAVKAALAGRAEILGEFVVLFHPDPEPAHA